MTEFCAIRAKTYAFAVDDGKKIGEKKKAKGTKKCLIKSELMLQVKTIKILSSMMR